MPGDPRGHSLGQGCTAGTQGGSRVLLSVAKLSIRVWVFHPCCVAAHPESMCSPASPRLTLRPSAPSVPFPLLATSDTPPPGSPPGSPAGPRRALLHPPPPLPTVTSRSGEMTRSVAGSQLCAQRRPQHVWGSRSREGHLGRGRGLWPCKEVQQKELPRDSCPPGWPTGPLL